jgi:hypothetical protein
MRGSAMPGAMPSTLDSPVTARSLLSLTGIKVRGIAACYAEQGVDASMNGVPKPILWNMVHRSRVEISMASSPGLFTYWRSNTPGTEPPQEPVNALPDAPALEHKGLLKSRMQGVGRRARRLYARHRSGGRRWLGKAPRARAVGARRLGQGLPALRAEKREPVALARGASDGSPC